MFPLRDWRRTVMLAGAAVGSDAIAPFGFELTGSPGFLSSYLRYLFVYATPAATQPAATFPIDDFMASVREQTPDLANTIAIVDCDRVAVPSGIDGAWRTLILRSVDGPRPLIDTWGKYVVAAALSCNRRRITAVTDFNSDLMAQRYCCQLAVMHDALCSCLPDIPPLTQKPLIAAQLRRLQQVALDARYDMSAIDSHTSQEIYDAIERYYSALNERLTSTADVADRIAVPDFHGRRPLEFPSKAVLNMLADRAVQRYYEYELKEGPSAAGV